MDKIIAGDELTSSGQSNSEIIEALREVFPEIFRDGKVDFELLKTALGEAIEESDERFGLSWKGKRESLIRARQKSNATLRPNVEESIHWDTTKNVFIEGDNFLVQQLLLKSYSGRVKLIYIDPPYNTDADTLYPDNFSLTIDEYLRWTQNISKDGEILSTNKNLSGRFHSKWLNDIYQRLLVARSLLHKEGLIFVSIDDVELPHLLMVMNEVFGEENFQANISWQKRYTRSNNTLEFTTQVEHIVVFGSSADASPNLLPRTKETNDRYTNPDNDPRGPWKGKSMLNPATPDERPTMCYTITNPNNGKETKNTKNAWRVAEDEFIRLAEIVHSDETNEWSNLYWGMDGQKPVPEIKGFLSEVRGLTPINFWSHQYAGNTDSGTEDAKEIFGAKVFDNPKPLKLIRRIIEHACKEGDIVMDFYAGSGTTGQAVFEDNLECKKNLQFILVQAPEKLDPKKKIQKKGADYCDKMGKPRNIAELTKQRLRNTISKLENEEESNLDLGFRVFKLDTSNIKQWDGGSENLHKSLEDYVNQIKDDRTSMDILCEVMLKSGIQLTADIEEVEIGDNKVLSVDNCRLLACLDKEIKSEAVADLASKMVELKNANPDADCMVLFLDSAFADSSGKLNMSETLKQNGFGNIRSI